MLRCIREHDEVRLTEIAPELDVANSTVHAHLTTPQQLGFVSKTSDGYQLGLQFLDYGMEARKQRTLYHVAKGMVDDLTDQTIEKVWCIVEDQGLAVYFYGASGSRSVQTYADEGNRTGLHHLAVGKAILAHLPQERVDEIIDTHGLPRLTEHTITDQDDLYDELKTVRDRGVAFNIEESVEGLHASGAPVCGPNNIVYGAISMSAPANRMRTQSL